jgi:hypothetical protein
MCFKFKPYIITKAIGNIIPIIITIIPKLAITPFNVEFIVINEPSILPPLNMLNNQETIANPAPVQVETHNTVINIGLCLGPVFSDISASRRLISLFIGGQKYN